MPNIVTNLPNFVSGVSQQPRTMRFPSQAEESINTFPSVVEGLTKRPPTQHIKRLSTTATSAGYDATHFIDRSESERYIAEVRSGTLRVWDLYGNEKTVYYGNGNPSTTATNATSFLTGNPEDFKMLTIADYTFVLNKSVAPQLKTDVVTNRLFGNSLIGNTKTRRHKVAFITLKQFAERATCRIRIDTKLVGGHTRSCLYSHVSNLYAKTNDGTAYSPDTQVKLERSDNTGGTWTTLYSSNFDMNELMTNTEQITQGFYAWMYLNNPFYASPSGGAGSAQDLATATGIAGWQIKSSGSTLMIWNTSTSTPNAVGYDANGDLDWGISVSDSASGAFFNLNWEEVQSFADLPRHGTINATFKIVGYPQDTGDEYWVKFAMPNNFNASTNTFIAVDGEGQWRETLKPGEVYSINPTTMPWALIRLSSGDFAFTPLDGVARTWGAVTFTPPKWEDRICGDLTSNKNPSFLNLSGVTTKKITDIFFYKNRLGFLSEENVIFSEAGEYFNFFRTTMTQTLDTDPIDIASSSVNVTNINYAIPFFDRLLLFAENNQFSIVGNENLTAKTASIQTSTSYSAISNVAPISVGKNVYFPYFKDNYSGVREYFLNPENAFMEANDITLNIPKYIEGKIKLITASDTESLLAVLSSAFSNIIYFYKYLNIGNERVQGAWNKFVFDTKDEILNCFFKKEILYLTIQRQDGVYLEKIDFQAFQNKEFLPYMPRMDRMVRINSTGATYPTGGNFANLAGVTSTYNAGSNQTTITLPFQYNSTPLAVAGASLESNLSLKLDGTENSYAHSSQSTDFYKLNLLNEFTISAHFKPNNLSNQVLFVLDKGQSSSIWQRIQINIQSGNLVAYITDNEGKGYTATITSASYQIPISTWSYFCLSLTIQPSYTYAVLTCGSAENSSLFSSAFGVSSPATPVGNLGTNVIQASNFYMPNYSGLLDNISILNTAYLNHSTTTNAEYPANIINIYKQFNVGFPTYPSIKKQAGKFLVSFFSFDGSDGDLIKDIHSEQVVFDNVKNKFLSESNPIYYPTTGLDTVSVVSHSVVSAQSVIVVSGALPAQGGPLYFGIPYQMLHTITPVSLRAPGQKGGQILVSSAEYQAKYCYLAFTNSKYFEVVVTSEDAVQGNSYKYRFENKKGLKTGIYKFPMFLKSNNCFISFLNPTIYPSCFVSADFEGTISNSFQRA